MFSRSMRLPWRRLFDDIKDYFFNRAGTEAGFLHLVGWVRFVALISLVVLFGVDQPISLIFQASARYVLWGYFALIISLRFVANFRPRLFESSESKILQIVVDTLVVAFFYVASGDPRSDVFAFYFLPMLIIARYFDLRAIFFFLVACATATLLAWWIIVTPPELISLRYWLTVLLPRLGFLGIFTIFYLIYYRRRKTIGNIDNLESSVLSKFKQLGFGFFSVDHNLRLLMVNDVMAHRHGLNLIGDTCYHRFCKPTANPNQPCDECPLAQCITRNENISSFVKLVDKRGFAYSGFVSASPMIDSDTGEVIGASAVVKDFDEWANLEEELVSFASNIERTVDKHTQEDRARAEEMTRQLAAISRSSAAALTPEHPLGLDEIVRSAATLLRCQAGDVRQPGFEKGTERSGLILVHAFGYTHQDVEKKHFLDLRKPSIVVDAFNSEEPRWIGDVQSVIGAVQFSSVVNKYGLHSMACFPLVARGTKVGTLSLYRNRQQDFSPEEIRLGTVVANNLAAAIYNQNLLEQLSTEAEVRQRALDALMALSNQLVPYDNIRSLAKLVADLIRDELHAEVSAVFLLNGKILSRIAISGIEAEWFSEESYLIGEGLTGRVLLVSEGERYGQPVYENNVNENSRVIPEHVERYSQRLKTRVPKHLIAVPLNGHEGTFGILRVVNKLTRDADLDPKGFTLHDLNLMKTIACIVAVAMENSRRLAEQTLLMEIGRAVTTTLSAEEILQQSLMHAVTLLDAEAGSILLPEKASGGLKFTVTVGEGAESLRGLVLPAGKGIANYVTAQGLPLLVTNVRNHPHFYSNIDTQISFNTRSMASVPFATQRNVKGVIEIVNKRIGEFTQADLNLLDSLSKWVAIALDKAYIFESEQERRLLTESLLKATRALSSTLDLDQILSNILVQLQHVVHYNTASLFLLEGNHLIMKTNAGFADDEKAALKGAKLDTQINIPFKRMAVYPHHPIMIPDAHKEKIFDELIGTKRIRSWIGVPLLYHGEIIGQLSVDNWKPNQYDEDDVNLVTAFAQQATSAIANAHLFSDQKEWANRLLVLNKTLGDVSSVHSIEERLDRIAYGTVGLLGCDMGGVVLYDEQKKEIYMPLDYGYHGIIKGQPIVFRQNIDLPSVQDLFSPNVISSSDSVSNPSLVSILHGIRDAINATNIMISPLSASGRYIGFLYAARNTTHVFSDNEKSLLTIFARHAGIATRNIELRHQDERRAELLELFHQIGVAVQRTSDLERILNIILTGVTAEYGLRFNRAMLLLMDSTRKYLVGCTGIGQTNKLEAEAIWETLEHGEHSFNHYAQEVLEYGVPNWTPIHYLAKNLRIPIKTDSGEIFSRVVMTQQSEIVDPITGTYLIDADFYQSFEPSAFVLVPILVEGKVLGVLVADNKFTGIPIIRKDFDLLATCASQAAMAIERSSLYEQLQHRIAVLHHLQKVAQNISELSDLREALQGIVKAANQVLEADVSYLVPYDKETGELLVELAVSEGDNGSFEHARKFSDRGLTTLVINEPSGLVVISDLTAHPELVSRFAAAEDIHSAAVIRLEFHNEIVGILYVNYRRHYDFADSDQKTLRMFADQTAVAIRNARLMEQLDNFATHRERDRLREDLHDALNILQFKVMVPVEDVRDRIKETGSEGELELLNKLWRYAHYTYQRFKLILQDMRDPVLIERGLVAAIRSNILDVAGFPITLNETKVARLPPEVELALYRICQEAINNITEHAYSKRENRQAVIDLTLNSESVRLHIADDGSGFSPENAINQGKGLGLQAMENWAKRVNGKILIASSPGEGTRVEVEVPLKEIAS